MKIDIKFDGTQVTNLLREMPQVARKALLTGVNKTATGARAQFSKLSRKRYNIKAARLKQSVTLKRASRSVLQAEVVAQGKPPGLQNYGARQTRSGVSVMVLRGHRTKLPRAFMGNAPAAGPQVWVRTGESKRVPTKGRYAGRVKREPVRRLFGPSVPAMMRSDDIRRPLSREVRARLQREVNNQIRFQLDKLGKGRK